jgi:hypothetical protein
MKQQFSRTTSIDEKTTTQSSSLSELENIKVPEIPVLKAGDRVKVTREEFDRLTQGNHSDTAYETNQGEIIVGMHYCPCGVPSDKCDMSMLLSMAGKVLIKPTA